MTIKEKERENIKFHHSFEWGAAFSGPQTENDNRDGKTNNVWDEWYKKEPNSFWENEFVLTDYRKDYRKIIDMAKKIGLRSLRTSIQWSRFMPDGKNVSQSALQYYRSLFNEMKANNIKPFACLMHFDVPMFLHKKGGFENDEAPLLFANYAKKAFELLNDLVDTWFTFNEPIVPVDAGYLGKYHQPQVTDMKRAMKVLHNYLMSHLRSVAIFRQNHKGKIGIIVNITPSIPKNNSKLEKEAANWADIFKYKAILDVVLLGKYPKLLLEDAKKHKYLWKITNNDQELMEQYSQIDILGVNYYAPMRTRALQDHEKEVWSNYKAPSQQYFKAYHYKRAIMNKYRGWEILPRKIYDVLMMIKNTYNNQKTFVSENGIGVNNENQFRMNGRMIDDHYRVKFISDHLFWVNIAIKKGANCFGYHVWTLADNWSWLNSYKNRYGLIEFDKQKKQFYPKKSALWFKRLIINNGFKMNTNDKNENAK